MAKAHRGGWTSPVRHLQIQPECVLFIGKEGYILHLYTTYSLLDHLVFSQQMLSLFWVIMIQRCTQKPLRHVHMSPWWSAQVLGFPSAATTHPSVASCFYARCDKALDHSAQCLQHRPEGLHELFNDLHFGRCLVPAEGAVLRLRTMSSRITAQGRFTEDWGEFTLPADNMLPLECRGEEEDPAGTMWLFQEDGDREGGSQTLLLRGWESWSARKAAATTSQRNS